VPEDFAQEFGGLLVRQMSVVTEDSGDQVG
jgi:hypothetical protein